MGEHGGEGDGDERQHAADRQRGAQPRDVAVGHAVPSALPSGDDELVRAGGQGEQDAVGVEC
ncbi:MAG TPA: hypothetical protein DD664_10005 [Janibacter terrae]|nr:hypothetical protein [Janibacter terrae]